MNTNLEKEIFATKVNRNLNSIESLKSYGNVIPYQNEGLPFILSHSKLGIFYDNSVFHTEANNLKTTSKER